TGLGGGIPGFSEDNGPEYLVPGSYQVDNGPGNGNVGSFQATLDLPAAVNWTNPDAFTSVARSSDLTFTWEGGNPDKEYVVIAGISNNQAKGVVAQFTCTERVSAGQFTVPAVVVANLPESGTLGTAPDGSPVPSALFGVGTSPIQERARFTAGGIDAAFFGYQLYNVKLVPVP
ncbi:MAG: hypothetical protein NTY38_11630, partial [Acidobacteria bacterium]|nr:hypothetical protein [Acidobacteriota bacterium]